MTPEEIAFFGICWAAAIISVAIAAYKHFTKPVTPESMCGGDNMKPEFITGGSNMIIKLNLKDPFSKELWVFARAVVDHSLKDANDNKN